MKKIILLVILVNLILVSCSGDPGNVADGTSADDVGVVSATVTEASGTTGDSVVRTSLRDIVPVAVAAGNFGDTMDLIYNDDEYADDVLEFAYGIESELAEKIEAYVLSEQSGMSAYSFAYFKFVDGASSEDIENVKAAVNDVYVAGLKSSLEAYNPEAYALCSNALFSEVNRDLVFMICEEGDSRKVLSALGA